MAFELTVNNFNNGQGYVVMPLLASLMLFSSLTAPVSIADMRSELEAAQPQPFEDDDWNVLVAQLAAVQLDTSVLTSAERAVYNTLRSAASPPPSTRCCSTVIPSLSDGLTQGYLYSRAGAPTQVAVEFHIDKSYTCNIATIEVTLNAVGLAPPATPVVFAVNYTNCNDLGKAVYSYYWATFLVSPVGSQYSFEVTYKDANGVIIAAYTTAYDVTVQ